MALNDTAGGDAQLDTTPVAEQQAVEEVEQTNEPSAEVSQEESTETTGEAKKGLSNRVRELNAAKKAAEQRAQSLEEKLAELTRTPSPQGGYQPPYNPQAPLIAPGEEIDANELNRRMAEREQRILAQADGLSQLRARQSEAVNRINAEASEVTRKYPELDPDSDSFNKELSDTIAEATEAYIKNAPYTASVKQFVEKLMKPYKGAVDKQVGQATENIAKQVSQTALRPTSVHKPEKTAAEKSIAELEQELGVVHS